MYPLRNHQILYSFYTNVDEINIIQFLAANKYTCPKVGENEKGEGEINDSDYRKFEFERGYPEPGIGIRYYPRSSIAVMKGSQGDGGDRQESCLIGY
ncbi:predicted protein [Sclerotinia sclerotiorum 1980 UF-70]|uniref:Uncharacterized protein n=1 Tax=Sclerotinia sclerotiorum (strain ATCC 18683 / 1980 / Ss-1) TaxID=665079 RepID=A7F625_SCLS1|nr:predicted protein [Sclerotinia sclerotiorum 1980 UF-70]EDN98196.1 predicted protein [Sclerotinia sclerotiorum 1980 UF-70]